jgi:hypothetical protein
MHEMSKGEESFWGPYFEIAHDTDLPCFWEEADLDVLEDELLRAEVYEYRKDFESEFQQLIGIAKIYPE